MNRLTAFALIFILICTQSFSALAASLGPASSYEELLELLSSAKNGDTLLIDGEFSADGKPISTEVSVHIRSAGDAKASIHGLQLRDASISFADIQLSDMDVRGMSNITLGNNVHVTGISGRSGLHFEGNGTLIVERGCSIQGGSESAGVSISHNGGDFYGSIEGSIRGGDGRTGGAGLVVSPLSDAGAMMITGSILGGSGDSLGGHALNLYDLTGNAYITIDGNLQGGSGSIGGDGIQLVSANDTVHVGISGRIRGGSGDSYGGSALILMNPSDSSSFHLSGFFSGGDALNADAQPGTSLQLVGDAAVLRARINDCILEDGRSYAAPTPSPEPVITPLPEIPVSEMPMDTPIPEETPAPEGTPSKHSSPDDTPVESDPPAPDSTPEPQPSDSDSDSSCDSSSDVPDTAPDAESVPEESIGVIEEEIPEPVDEESNAPADTDPADQAPDAAKPSSDSSSDA